MFVIRKISVGKGGALSNGALFASLTKGVGALPAWGARVVQC